MTDRQKSLSRRREELIARSTLQREQLVARITDIRRPTSGLPGGNILIRARQKPMLSGLLAFLAFLFFRRRRFFSFFATGMVVFKTWQRFSPYLMPVFRKLKQLPRKSTKGQQR
jgi:hypothetical protein